MYNLLHCPSLDDDGNKRFAQLMDILKGDLSKLSEAVRTVLQDEKEKGRRSYLWRELKRLAKERMADWMKPAVLTEAMERDAAAHAYSLLRDVPEEDR